MNFFFGEASIYVAIFRRARSKLYFRIKKKCKELGMDTGIGIPKDKHEMIFQRFGQVENNLSRQAEGSGIGLALVKMLVEILGGSIQVDSELEVGKCH